LRIPVERPVIQETTIMGAAFLAGLQFGMYKSIADLCNLWKTDQVFEPIMSKDQADSEYSSWLKVVKKLID
jgi:glycerol kinase